MSHARLLDIAVREFGAKGLEGASTRGIAAAAETAMSSITYHYGGKDGLYLAAADHIAGRMAVDMADALAAEAGVAEGDAAGARAALHRLIGRLGDKIAAAETADWSLFILREQLSPGAAFARIWAGVMGQVTIRVAELVRIATLVDLPTARIATVTLLAQALAARSCRATLLRLCEVDDLDAATRAGLKARIAANIDAILDHMVAGEQQ